MVRAGTSEVERLSSSEQVSKYGAWLPIASKAGISPSFLVLRPGHLSTQSKVNGRRSNRNPVVDLGLDRRDLLFHFDDSLVLGPVFHVQLGGLD